MKFFSRNYDTSVVSKRPKTDSSGIMVSAVISWVRVCLLPPLFTLQIEDFCCCHYTILHTHNIFQLYWYLSNYSYNETCLNCCLNYLICNSQHCAAADHNISVRKMYQLDANNFTMIFSHKWPLHVWILTDKQCTRLHTNSTGPQPQHLWHDTTCGSETTYI